MGALNLKLEGSLPHYGRGSEPPGSAGKVWALAHRGEAGVDGNPGAVGKVEVGEADEHGDAGEVLGEAPAPRRDRRSGGVVRRRRPVTNGLPHRLRRCCRAQRKI
jgi:hypothetical protein